MLLEDYKVFQLSFSMSNNKKEEFIFPDIPGQSYPVYAVGKGGKLVNFKSLVYPNSSSIKKFTRKRQLRYRSLQAKIFDAIIRIGYFDPLIVYKEFPIIIENSRRLPDMDSGLFWLIDYYFPELKLAVELDSDYHDDAKDATRDKYLKAVHGIEVFRIKDLQKEKVQETKFKELTTKMRSITPIKNPLPLIFTTDLYDKLKRGT